MDTVWFVFTALTSTSTRSHRAERCCEENHSMLRGGPDGGDSGERRLALEGVRGNDLGDMAARPAVDPLQGAYITAPKNSDRELRSWHLSTYTRNWEESTLRGIEAACQRNMSRPSTSGSSSTLYCLSENDNFTSPKRSVEPAQLPRTSRPLSRAPFEKSHNEPR